MTIAITSQELYDALICLQDKLKYKPVSEKKLAEVELGLYELTSKACPNERNAAAYKAQNDVVPT